MISKYVILAADWWFAVAILLATITFFYNDKEDFFSHFANWLFFPLHIIIYVWLFFIVIFLTAFNNKMMVFYLEGLLLSFKQLLESLLTKNKI